MATQTDLDHEACKADDREGNGFVGATKWGHVMTSCGEELTDEEIGGTICKAMVPLSAFKAMLDKCALDMASKCEDKLGRLIEVRVSSVYNELHEKPPECETFGAAKADLQEELAEKDNQIAVLESEDIASERHVLEDVVHNSNAALPASHKMRANIGDSDGGLTRNTFGLPCLPDGRVDWERSIQDHELI